MTSSHRTAALCFVAAVSLGLTACGSDDSASDTPDDATTLPADDTLPPVAADAVVIGTANLGGDIVDPKPHAIDEIGILESYPEQLAVTFTAGDPNCTAATATARASADTVVVSLEVGITEDALTRSCVAGNDFEQTVVIALDEGLDGRDVVPRDV